MLFRVVPNPLVFCSADRVCSGGTTGNNEVCVSKLRASKSRSQGREGGCVIFEHPGGVNCTEKPAGVRRELGPRAEEEADALDGELNVLLANPKCPTPAAKERALREFNERVVAIFYDSMEAEIQDGW